MESTPTTASPAPVAPASPAALRGSFTALRDHLAAEGADVRDRDAEIALRDAAGTARGDVLAGWVAGSSVDLSHRAWYPTPEIAAQAAQFWAAEEGRGGVAHPAGSVPWPAEAWRAPRVAAPAPPSPTGAVGPQVPWLAIGLGAAAVGGLTWWAMRRSD